MGASPKRKNNRRRPTGRSPCDGSLWKVVPLLALAFGSYRCVQEFQTAGRIFQAFGIPQDDFLATRHSHGLAVSTSTTSSTPYPTDAPIVAASAINAAPSDPRIRCWPWTEERSADGWWASHPTWEPGPENDTHTCFHVITKVKKREFFRNLYDAQFHSDCNKTFTRYMWSSGWNADMANIVYALKYAMDTYRPFQVQPGPWHYADPKDKHRNIKMEPVCPTGDMFCYFLPLSNCSAGNIEQNNSEFPKQLYYQGHGDGGYQWLYEYATRMQTWLRHRLYQHVQQQQRDINMKVPCAAMHVRRGDVVTSAGIPRKYHAISEYFAAAADRKVQLHENILLLTDDQNAVEEALVEFPNYNWMYLDRPRFRAAEGGWENHLPSKDPAREVVVLLTEYTLARQCDQLVHSSSNFAERLYDEIMAWGNHSKVDRVNLDKGKNPYNLNNTQTKNISKRYNLTTRANTVARP